MEDKVLKRYLIVLAAITALVAQFAAGPAANWTPTVLAAPPPGFDNGNQSLNNLTRLAQNVNLSGLSSVSCSPLLSSTTPATDNVGIHSSGTPAALLAFGGPAHACSDNGGQLLPPDPSIAAGAGAVVETVNSAVSIFNRAGGLEKAVYLDNLFGEVGICAARVVFDPLPSAHWYIVATDGGSVSCSWSSGQSDEYGGYIEIAVSHTSDPTGMWDIYRVWNPYPYNPDNPPFPYNPLLGFSSDKVLVEFSTRSWAEGQACGPGHVCRDDYMVVIQKSDLIGLAPAPRGIAIRLSTETNHRLAVVPAIPLPSAEVPTAFAVYRGSDTLGKYESPLVIEGLPSSGVAFRETGIHLDTGTNGPDPAAQPGVSPNVLYAGDDRIQSVSLIAASSSTTNFSGVLWTAGADKCTPAGDTTERACLRLDQVIVDSSGQASLAPGSDRDVGIKGTDLLYPSVVGDSTGLRLWVADTRTSTSTFPTSELRLLTFGANKSGLFIQRMHTVQYGSGVFPYTTDQFPSGDSRQGLTDFGEYSGIYVDPTQPSGATVWAATENAAASKGGSWSTSIVEATYHKPVVSKVVLRSGFAGDTVNIFGTDFSQSSAVRFGGVPATSATFLGSNHLRATVPAQPPTTVNVFVTTVNGTDNPLPGPPLPDPSVADRFTYQSLLWASGTDPLGQVVAIDPSSDKRRFSIGIGAPKGTTGIVVSHDGRTVYATSPSSGILAWINAASGKLEGTLKVGVQPTEIAISPDDQWAFITDPGAFKGVGGVVPVQLHGPNGAPKALTAVKVPDPLGVAVIFGGSPAQTEVYATSGNTHGVLMMTYHGCPITVEWCPTRSLTTGTDAEPGPIVAGPDRIWIGTYGSNAGKVYDIDPASPAMNTNYVFMIDKPTALAVSANGHFTFAIAAASGKVYPIQHAPPSPDKVLPAFPLTDGPAGGGAVSFDGMRLFVAGGSSGRINVANVPSPYISDLGSGPKTSLELATNLPPRTDCGGAQWGTPASSVAFNQSPPDKNSMVTVTGSVLYCPPHGIGSNTAIPSVSVLPPNSSDCPKPFTLTSSQETLSAGTISFSFQFQATCEGFWSATPALGSFKGVGTAPPAFNPVNFNVFTYGL